MTLRAVLAAVTLVVAACGSGDPDGDYRRVLEEQVPPLADALEASVEPCLAEDFPVCQTQLARARDETRGLLDGLESADPPADVAADARALEGGLVALADALDQSLAAIEAGDEDRFANLREARLGAAVDVNNAIGGLNDGLGTDLPTL